MTNMCTSTSLLLANAKSSRREAVRPSGAVNAISPPFWEIFSYIMAVFGGRDSNYFSPFSEGGILIIFGRFRRAVFLLFLATMLTASAT